MSTIINENVKFSGWYDAPFPFGKTDFTLTIEKVVAADGTFFGRGTDKQGHFTIQGQFSCTNDNGEGDVTFVKDYVDKSHTNIQYEGKISGNTISGIYICYFPCSDLLGGNQLSRPFLDKVSWVSFLRPLKGI